jgi:DNA invertase Pin-like site-specific DNA recombinase
MPNHDLRVAIYARVSGEQQAREDTIDSQLEAVTQRIASGALVCDPELRFVDDGYSGTVLARPGLERLRDQAAAGAIDRISMLDPDRLSRKYAYQVLILEELTRCGVEVVFLRNPVGRGPEQDLLLQVEGMIAEYERAKIMERCRRGKPHAARRGSVNVLSGAPYGYRYVGKHEGGGEARYQKEGDPAGRGRSGPATPPCAGRDRIAPDFFRIFWTGSGPSGGVDGPTESGPGVSPEAVGGAGCHPQRPGRLGEGHPGEVAELDPLGRARVGRLQPGQGLVDRQDLVGGLGGGEFDFLEIGAGRTDPALLAPLASGPFHQDPAYGLGLGGEEMPPSVPVPVRVVADQAQVRLVDEGRGLECLAGLFPSQPPGGELPQLFVDQGQELPGRIRVALLDRRKHARHVTHGTAPFPSGWTDETTGNARPATP